jgi:hypothetical protein
MPPSQPALAQCLKFRHCGDTPKDHNILVNDFLHHGRLLVYDKDDTVVFSRGLRLQAAMAEAPHTTAAWQLNI